MAELASQADCFQLSVMILINEIMITVDFSLFMTGLSFKYRPPVKLLVFSDVAQSDIYKTLTLSGRFGALCTALVKLLRCVCRVFHGTFLLFCTYYDLLFVVFNFTA